MNITAISTLERNRSRALLLARRGSERVTIEAALCGGRLQWANIRPYNGGAWVSLSHSSADFAAVARHLRVA